MDIPRLYREIILNESAQPNGGGHLPFRHADAPVFQIFRTVYARIDVDVSARMTELAIDECGNTDKREIVAPLSRDETAEGHFGGGKLMLDAHETVHFRPHVDG